MAIAWVTLLAFVRISTNPRVCEQPLLAGEALAAVSSWLARASVSVLEAGEACWEIFRQLVVEAQVTGPLVMDAGTSPGSRSSGSSTRRPDIRARGSTRRSHWRGVAPGGPSSRWS